jgi:hypothetical protein
MGQSLTRHFQTESRNFCQQHQLLFACLVWFAIHLIRPPATFSPSDAEKELFCGTFSRRRCLRTARLCSRPPAANIGLISVTPSAYLNPCFIRVHPWLKKISGRAALPRSPNITAAQQRPPYQIRVFADDSHARLSAQRLPRAASR